MKGYNIPLLGGSSASSHSPWEAFTCVCMCVTTLLAVHTLPTFPGCVAKCTMIAQMLMVISSRRELIDFW